MSTKRGRPTNKALAERERRAKERYRRALDKSREAAELLYSAADRVSESKGQPSEHRTKHDLEQAAYAYVRANDAAGKASV